MNRFIISIALIATLCTGASASALEVRFASGQSALKIPFKLVNNHIYLQVRVNNAGPLWFLLDTGAGNIINQRHARSLGLKLDPVRQTTGVGENTVDFSFTENVSFDLPGVTITRQRFAVLSLENVEECLTKIDIDPAGKMTWRALPVKRDEAQTMDGVLGYEFFQLFVVEIDYASQAINLYDPQNYRYQGTGEKLPFELKGKHIYLRAPITASGHSPLNGLFMIDSGSATAMMLNSPFVAQNNLLPPGNQTVPFSVCGIGGDSNTQVGTLAELRLGKTKIESPVTMFSQAKNGVLANTDVSGSIGNAILRRFRVVFDYSRKQMILEQR